MKTIIENNGQAANIEISGIAFNSVNPVTGARKGWWIDQNLGMIIFYYSDGDSQVFAANLNTDRKIANKVKKLKKSGTFN